MSPSSTAIWEGRKFMWDGRVYATPEEAAGVVAGYENDRFEVRLVEQDGTFLVYTRRAVSQTAVSAP